MIKVLCLAVIAAVAVQAAPIDTIKLRFKISARDLPDKDTLGTIDPYVEIFYTEEGKKEETKLGRSGTLTDQENPDWGDVFEYEFVRAKRQRWSFKVYDHDNGREDDKAGIGYVDVADYVDKNQHLNVNLNKKGYLILSTVDPLPASTPPPPAQIQQFQSVPVVQHVQTVPVVQQVHTVPVVQHGAPVIQHGAPVIQHGVPVIQHGVPVIQHGVPVTGGVLLVPQPQIVTVPDKTKLKFKLSARDLPVKDKLGSVDPYVELFYTEGASTKENKFARSATINSNKNPQWGEIFEFDYDRIKQQKWLFKIYDHDVGSEDDSAGKVWVDVNDFVQKGQTITVNLSKKGTLTVVNAVPPTPTTPTQQLQHPVPIQQPQQVVVPAPVAASPAPIPQVSNPFARIKFRLSANGLEDKDILGTSDPHVRVFVKYGSEPESLIGSTAKLTDTENPSWPDIIDFEYEPSKQPKLHFVVLDEDDGRRDDELGDAWLDVNDYIKKNQDETLSLKKGRLNVSKV